MTAHVSGAALAAPSSQQTVEQGVAMNTTDTTTEATTTATRWEWVQGWGWVERPAA